MPTYQRNHSTASPSGGHCTNCKKYFSDHEKLCEHLYKHFSLQNPTTVSKSEEPKEDQYEPHNAASDFGSTAKREGKDRDKSNKTFLCKICLEIFATRHLANIHRYKKHSDIILKKKQIFKIININPKTNRNDNPLSPKQSKNSTYEKHITEIKPASAEWGQSKPHVIAVGRSKKHFKPVELTKDKLSNKENRKRKVHDTETAKRKYGRVLHPAELKKKYIYVFTNCTLHFGSDKAQRQNGTTSNCQQLDSNLNKYHSKFPAKQTNILTRTNPKAAQIRSRSTSKTVLNIEPKYNISKKRLSPDNTQKIRALSQDVTFTDHVNQQQKERHSRIGFQREERKQNNNDASRYPKSKNKWIKQEQLPHSKPKVLKHLREHSSSIEQKTNMKPKNEQQTKVLSNNQIKPSHINTNNKLAFKIPLLSKINSNKQTSNNTEKKKLREDVMKNADEQSSNRKNPSSEEDTSRDSAAKRTRIEQTQACNSSHSVGVLDSVLQQMGPVKRPQARPYINHSTVRQEQTNSNSKTAMHYEYDSRLYKPGNAPLNLYNTCA